LHKKRPTIKSLKFQLCASCRPVRSNILLHIAKLEKKNVNYFFVGNFELLEFKRVLITIISMNAKPLKFDVFHVHIAQDAISGTGHYPILNL